MILFSALVSLNNHAAIKLAKLVHNAYCCDVYASITVCFPNMARVLKRCVELAALKKVKLSHHRYLDVAKKNFLPCVPMMNVFDRPEVQGIRFAHSDIKVPDYSFYRRKDRKGPRDYNADDGSKMFTAGICIFGGWAALYGTKALVEELVSSMAITADMMALAKIEIKLGDVPEGKHVALKWRGKPLFIWHRTQADIDGARSVDISLLRDPQRDEDRVIRPEWLVVLGVCTHLGCVPLFGAGDYGGYYCPCHGSHYDASGRTRRGPAPTNMEVPHYEFIQDTLVVG
ncbi:Cytochrome b-c1 complex subunit Rieske [Blattella germanica]|nr:Cytochrome b-c1 complex subunit Rieske [Blattella germanica]